MPLSDLFSCDPSDLHSAITSEEPYSVGAWYMAKSIAAIELSMLGELVGVGTYQEVIDGFELVGESLEDGPWPQTIPECLVSALKELDDAAIGTVAPKWARIEEFRGHAAPTDLARYLHEVRAFFKKNPGPFFLVNAL